MGHIFIFAHQDLGTVVQVAVEKSAAKPLVEPTYTTKVLMGKDEDMTHVFSRAIAQTVYTCRAAKDGPEGPSPSTNLKPLLCTLALKDPTPSALNKVIAIIK